MRAPLLPTLLLVLSVLVLWVTPAQAQANFGSEEVLRPGAPEMQGGQVFQELMLNQQPSSPADRLLTGVEHLLANGEYRAALEMTQQALIRDRRNADAWGYRGSALRGLGQIRPAYEAYSEALSINRRHLHTHEALGQLYTDMGQMEYAQRQLALLVRICGRNCAETQALARYLSKAEQDQQ